ncbi:hypothetical protein M9Y10_040921 [Tritrichomonas musculus]|uniref:Calcineurin-like phosphoesterase domain-containing protein n=1 Tax=Tritrichomonas musculus TaxID=1915356 RepID=A0ABR2K2Z6_9EUKA
MEKNPRFYRVEIDDFNIFKGLIIADFHIGQFLSIEKEKVALINCLKSLIDHEKPTHVFILGDIIHFSSERTDEWYFDFFQLLEDNFSLPICIIPGNHDYDLSPYRNCFNLYKNEKNVKCYDVEFLEIKYSDNFSLFLGHDASYNMFVHFKSPIVQWMNEIRNSKYCKSIIKKNDVVIFGHTHEDIDDDETRNYTIAPFSISLEESSYGLISFNNGFKFDHKTSFSLQSK